MEETLASRWHRLLARLLDGLIIGIVLTPFNPGLYSSRPSATLFLALGLPGILLFLIGLAGFEGGPRGATPGKLIVGIRVADEHQRSCIGYRRAAIRRTGYVAGGLVLCLGWLWLIFDSRRQAWHDKLAMSIVIRAR